MGVPQTKKDTTRVVEREGTFSRMLNSKGEQKRTWTEGGGSSNTKKVPEEKGFVYTKRGVSSQGKCGRQITRAKWESKRKRTWWVQWRVGGGGGGGGVGGGGLGGWAGWFGCVEGGGCGGGGCWVWVLHSLPPSSPLLDKVWEVFVTEMVLAEKGGKKIQGGGRGIKKWIKAEEVK